LIFSPLSKAPVGESITEQPGLSSWSKWFAVLKEHIYHTQSYQVSLDPTSISANSESTQTFTVTGLKTNDIVLVNKPSKTADLSLLDAFVSAEDTLSLTFRNFSGSPIDPGSESYRIIAIRL
jgi:hypothetical protein